MLSPPQIPRAVHKKQKKAMSVLLVKFVNGSLFLLLYKLFTLQHAIPHTLPKNRGLPTSARRGAKIDSVRLVKFVIQFPTARPLFLFQYELFSSKRYRLSRCKFCTRTKNRGLRTQSRSDGQNNSGALQLNL